MLIKWRLLFYVPPRRSIWALLLFFVVHRARHVVESTLWIMVCWINYLTHFVCLLRCVSFRRRLSCWQLAILFPTSTLTFEEKNVRFFTNSYSHSLHIVIRDMHWTGMYGLHGIPTISFPCRGRKKDDRMKTRGSVCVCGKEWEREKEKKNIRVSEKKPIEREREEKKKKKTVKLRIQRSLWSVPKHWLDACEGQWLHEGFFFVFSSFSTLKQSCCMCFAFNKKFIRISYYCIFVLLVAKYYMFFCCSVFHEYDVIVKLLFGSIW